MRIYRDKNYRAFWRELVEALIDNGCVRETLIEEVAAQRRWHRNTVLGVFQALAIETFQYGGETYWRLSGKVVPILANKEPSQHAAAARA
jgi:hypothetical protein